MRMCVCISVTTSTCFIIHHYHHHHSPLSLSLSLSHTRITFLPLLEHHERDIRNGDGVELNVTDKDSLKRKRKRKRKRQWGKGRLCVKYIIRERCICRETHGLCDDGNEEEEEEEEKEEEEERQKGKDEGGICSGSWRSHLHVRDREIYTHSLKEVTCDGDV